MTLEVLHLFLQITTLESTVRTLNNLLNSQTNVVKTLTNDLQKAKSDLAAADKQLNDKLAKNTQDISGVNAKVNQALEKAGDAFVLTKFKVCLIVFRSS